MENNFPLNQFIKIPGGSNNDGQKKQSHFNDLGSISPSSAASSDTSEVDFSDMELGHLNDKILSVIKDSIPQVKFNTFFENHFSILGLSEDSARFSVSTEYIQEVINTQYVEYIRSAIRKILGKDYKVQIIVSNHKQNLKDWDRENLNNKEIKTQQKSETIDKGQYSVNRSMSAKDASFTLDLIPTHSDKIDTVKSMQLNHLENRQYGFMLDPNKTFDTFIIGPSNNMAYASAHAVAKNPGKVYPSLYIHSNSGLGKTHLLHAVANKIKEERPELLVYFTTARDFMNEMVNAMANKKINEFRKKYSENIDILMIDDVHELKGKQGTQNEFFHVFNELHNKGKQLIFTSDKNPKEIDGIEERIKTRLTWGLVLDIQPPDIETRIAILKRKAQEEDIFIPDEVINLIATHIKSNIRELESSLIRLTAYASVFSVDIDTEIAREQLNIIEFHENQSLTADTVVKKVAQYFSVHVADIKSRTRMREVTKARHVAMYLINHLVNMTLVEIGEYFSGRDHTSVIHAVEKVKKQIPNDSTLHQAIVDIENSLS